MHACSVLFSELAALPLIKTSHHFRVVHGNLPVPTATRPQAKDFKDKNINFLKSWKLGMVLL